MILYWFCILTFSNLLPIAVTVSEPESPNVKTSLFTELDIRRSCWDHDNINLLRARMIMQDLVPNKVPRDLAYLEQYLRSAEEAVVKHSPEGKVRRIMLMALSDVLGGYLQAVVMPLAKEAYYAGNIDYGTMSRLHIMYVEMKSRLRTDGGRWSRPIDMTKFPTKVTRLRLTSQNSDLACKALVVLPEESCKNGMPRIAIPYLDYNEKPGAVALPLKTRNLYSLKTSASSHILVRFYILARECLSQMDPADEDRFNFYFVQWLSLKVVPHLYEENWYPGFGGVMRIIETVNETAITQYNRETIKYNNANLENSITKGCGFWHAIKTMVKYHPWFLLLMLLLLLLLLLLCFCCICCAISCRKGGRFLGLGMGGKPSGILNAVLSIYCGFKDNEGANMKGAPSSDFQQPSYQSYSGSRQQPPSYETTSTVGSSSDDEESITSSVS